jgi:spore germination cell wall hydrolase CwlJ-like protein
MAIVPRQAGWTRSRKAAIHAMLGMSDITIGRATHYHTTAIQPYWSSTLLRTANIGTHVFYRFPSRREKALLLEASYKF